MFAIFTNSFFKAESKRCRLLTKTTRGFTGLVVLFLLLLGSTALNAQAPCIDGESFEWGSPQIISQPTFELRHDVFAGNMDDIYTGSKDYKLFGPNNNDSAYNEWTLSPMQSKSDIMNAAAVIYTNINSDDCIDDAFPGSYDPARTYLFFAGDRESNLGTGYIGFWFLLNGSSATTIDGQNVFDPPHSVGDLLILADFDQGGRNATVTVLKWVGPGNGTEGNNLSLEPVPVGAQVAQNNATQTPVPSEFIVPEGQTIYDYNEFYEGVIDLTDVFDLNNNPSAICNATWILETRASKEITADLKDYVGGNFNLTPTATVSDDSVCVGEAASLSVTITQGVTVITDPIGDGFTITWSGPGSFTGQGTPTITFDPAALSDDGTYSVVVTSPSGCDVNDDDTGTLTVNAAASLSCPANSNQLACQTQGAIDTAFAAWLSQFTYTAGDSDVTVSYSINGGDPVSDLSGVSAPDACGGLISIGMSISDDCIEDSCSATFTVANAPDLSVSCPGNQNIPACSSQASIDAAFATWIGQFSYSGGCGTVATNLGSYSAPDACGGSVTVNYSASDNCEQQESCSATFTVANAPDLSVSCPGNYTVDSCATQEDIDSAFANWIGSFSYTGGCGTVDSDLSGYSAPSACGGSVTVNYSASDNCEQQESCSATFTVVPIPPSCTASVINDVQCQGIDINLHVEGSGCRTPFTYEWSGASAGYLNDIYSSDPVMIGAPVGSHDFTVTVTDADGCQSTCNVTATVYDCVPECETGYGVATNVVDGYVEVNDDISSCFRNDGFRRWGWVNTITEADMGTPVVLSLYAGAAQCDLSRGTYSGTVTIDYGLDGTVQVCYNMAPGFVISEAHVWIGCDPYPTTNQGAYTVAPGQYNFNAGDLGYIQNSYCTPPISASGDFYVIAHAVVCETDIPDWTYLPASPNEDGMFDELSPNEPLPNCSVDTGGWGRSLDFTAYPVPFNNEINIQYQFEYDTNVKIEIYDLKGSLIREATDANYIKGNIGRTTFDMSTADSQMYFVRMTTAEGTLVKKIVSSRNNFKE